VTTEENQKAKESKSVIERHEDLPVEGLNEELDTPCAVHDAMDLNCAMHKLVEDEVGFNSQDPVSGFFEVEVLRYFSCERKHLQNADVLIQVFHKRFSATGTVLGNGSEAATEIQRKEMRQYED
jgi:hypothetical protein